MVDIDRLHDGTFHWGTPTQFGDYSRIRTHRLL